MNRLAFPTRLLCSVVALAFSLVVGAAEPGEQTPATKLPAGAPDAADMDNEKDKDTDKRQMLQIWKAITEYQKAHGHVPNYLSDLVPEYLPDKGVLVSPVANAYHRGSGDPKLPCSYSYEFSAGPYGERAGTFRTFKEGQMKEFGPVVPILRCFAHGPVVMNVAYSGDYFESKLLWENSPAAHELMQKLGLGPGFDDGDFAEITVVDELSGEALPDAEVRLTRRQFHDLSLPDRTLKTDAEGKARVPLGPPPARRLVVTVFKPGYTSLPQSWREGDLPVMQTWPMTRAAAVGGLVKDAEGKPLAGATVVVYAPGVRIAVRPNHPPPAIFNDEQWGRPLTRVAECTTDAEGRWQATVALNFQRLRFNVARPEAWPAVYHCGGEAGADAVDREALVEQTAVFQLAPAPVLAGVVLAPDGTPLANETVSITRASHLTVALPPGMAEPASRQPAEFLRTDAAGRFSMKWSRPGDVTVSAQPARFAFAARLVKVEPGMPPVELKASPRRKIAGQVHDSDGHPLAGVQVMFIGWAEASVTNVKVAETDANGQFTWDAAPSDQIGLTFTSDSFAPSTEWVPADKIDAVQVELRR